MYSILPALGAMGGYFGVNLYDFLVRIMGNEILRTILSFVIRQTLTRIGL